MNKIEIKRIDSETRGIFPDDMGDISNRGILAARSSEKIRTIIKLRKSPIVPPVSDYIGNMNA